MVELGLIGKTLKHSFSPAYFEEKFKKEKIKGVYSLFPLSNISEFPELLKRYPGLQGLNVTFPYKESIIEYLDWISEDARTIGAVNVIKIIRIDKGQIRLEGYNTDWIGFKESLKPLLHKEIDKALVLGTGGASKAVGYALKKLNITPLFVSRNPVENKTNVITYTEVSPHHLAEYPLIVNTTPLGTFPNIETFPALPYQELNGQNISYDLVYNPEETEFLRKSRQRGALIKNGLEMLYIQADEALKIFMK